MALQVPTVTVDDLRGFHAKHFAHAPVPEHIIHGVEQTTEEYHDEKEDDEDDGLGYYPDGTKRTLTDEQIAMFRHSEIQAILRKRRHRQEEGELSDEGEAASDVLNNPQRSPGINPIAPDVASPTPSTATGTANIDKVKSGRVEKPKIQQWAKSSARTQARNKKHNQNYRRKKKEDRKKREQAERNARGDDEESDEWDPWHQANGPDVQTDEAIDLDY